MANNRQLKYPSDLNSTNKAGFVKFVAIDWNVTNKRNLDIKNTSNIVDTIFLPLPNNGLEDSISINWEEDVNLGGNISSNVLHSLGSYIKNAISDVSKKAEFKVGKTLNDLAASTFQNVEFRTCDFSWSFIPASKKEASAIKNIVKSFKKNSVASYQNINILDFPSFWTVAVYAPNFKKIFSYKTSVCVSVSSNEMPDSEEAFHSDGSPVKTDLSVSFKELFKITSRDVE